jgi:iron(III) transport system substrate-binding protein
VRKFQTLVAAAVAVTLLAGCGGGAASPAASGSSSPAPAGGSGETLVIYTNSNGEGRGDWVTAKAAEAGFKIEIVGAGGADATNKLIAEKNNPIADIAFGLNNMYFSQIKAEDALEPYEPAWAGDVDQELGDGETYWPLVKQAILLGYNADKISKDAAPQDWTDLWTKDGLKARYERVTGLGTATAQLVFAGILSRYRDDSGDLGISQEQAQKFIDWFGSAEVQGEFAQKFNSMPVNKAAEAKANPEVVAFFADLKQQDIDWEFVQENMGAWVEKIELEYMT